MGDRVNVQIVDGGKRVNLYSHWGGSDMPETVRVALAKRQRWTDGAYLARIIFCTMIAGDVDGETGFGISPPDALPDNEHPLIIVSADDQTVTIEGNGDIKPKRAKKYSFEEYVTLKSATWAKLGA